MKRIKKIGKFKSKFEAVVSANIHKLIGFEPPYEAKKFKFKVAVKASQGICLSCGSKAVAKWSRYEPDFEIATDTFIEAKGKLTASNRSRLIAFSEEHPNVKIYLLFQRDNWLTKRHANKYSEWAQQHGFENSVGTSPPKQWLSRK